MTKHGTKDRAPAVKACAEALFRLREEQKREGQSAIDDYLAKEDGGARQDGEAAGATAGGGGEGRGEV
jgi:hypothetical protein